MSAFYESKSFNRAKNLFIGAGASVVLLGALFKILHWPGANIALMVGMFTEAFIFLFLGILPPHKEYHWEKIYPNLDVAPEVVHNKKGKDKSNAVQASGSVTQELDKILEEAKVEKDLLSRLGQNLGKLGENIEKMNEVADAGAATSEYSESARGAAKALNEMKVAYNDASVAVSELTDISEGTKEYHNQVKTVSQNLAALNAVYELELQDTNSHLKAMNKFYGSLSSAMNNLNDSVEDTKSYKDEIAILSKNLKQLNGVYGNMLNAMAITPGAQS